ncbi:hypothetical protein EJ08DRAFT_322714 [Tothia fuscella]|uniref:Uncharacterized protein n=1 Tax=Tothia fuscella TaxID=1048955 RepID=A0A9P4TXA3_9PEZI|nr:hypothetical protein EJ08DRAFT_322714 [Tothia fuscella]
MPINTNSNSTPQKVCPKNFEMQKNLSYTTDKSTEYTHQARRPRALTAPRNPPICTTGVSNAPKKCKKAIIILLENLSQQLRVFFNSLIWPINRPSCSCMGCVIYPFLLIIT